MKKRLLIAAIAVFGWTSVNAQDISFGVKAGINFPNLHEKGEIIELGTREETEMLARGGWHFGILGEMMLTEKFGGQLEVFFSGGEVEYQKITPRLIYTTGEGGYFENTEWVEHTTIIQVYKLNRIGIPLLAKFYPFHNFNIHAGPQVTFLLSAKEQDLKSTVIGVSGGIGYELDIGLFMSARYYNGFTNLVDYSESYTLNLSSFQFSLGYKF